MEEAIKNYLKRSFLSLIPRDRRRLRTSPARAVSTPAVSINRLQSGLPQSFPAAIPDDGHPGRRRGPHPGYTRGRYVRRSGHATGICQPMFRIT